MLAWAIPKLCCGSGGSWVDQSGSTGAACLRRGGQRLFLYAQVIRARSPLPVVGMRPTLAAIMTQTWTQHLAEFQSWMTPGPMSFISAVQHLRFQSDFIGVTHLLNWPFPGHWLKEGSPWFLKQIWKSDSAGLFSGGVIFIHLIFSSKFVCEHLPLPDVWPLYLSTV